MLSLSQVVDLYIYDICYAFFDVSSSAYSLENEAGANVLSGRCDPLRSNSERVIDGRPQCNSRV